MNTAQNIFNVLIVIALVAIGAVTVSRSDAPSLGTTGAASYVALPTWFGGGLSIGSSQQLNVSSTGGLTLGASGTALSQVIDTTCTAIAYTSLAATSSQQLDCPVTGAVSTDRVLVALPLAASNAALGFTIGGAAASTTAGYVSFRLYNLTGAATSSYAQATTSVHVIVTR